MATALLNWVISLFHHYGYRILFFSAFLESLPFIGVIMPGATIAVFAGFVARRHALHFSLAFLVLAAGAFIGDVTNYFLGRHFGYAFLKKYGKYFFLTEGRFESIRNHIKKNRGKTLILGRFTSFTRSIAPFAAGASAVEVVPFLGYTFISAFAWAFSHLLIGFIFGRWLERISRYLGLIFFLAILGGFGLVYVYRFINQRHHIFKRLHVYTLVAMIFSLFLFTSTLQGVLDYDWLFILNRSIERFAIAIERPWLTGIMIQITNFGSVYFFILIAVLMLYLISKKRYYLASLTAVSSVIGGILLIVLKEVINLPRPENPLVHTMLSAFPSGHATASVIFGSFVFLSFIDSFKSLWAKYVLFFGVLIGVLLVCFSRIYLNVHWTTDVIAGISLGLFSVTFTILLFRIVLFAKRWLY